MGLSLSLVAACRPAMIETPSPPALSTPAVAGDPRFTSTNQPFLFQQQVVYDRRGATMNYILLNHAALLVNPTSSLLRGSITVRVPPERATRLSFDDTFSIMVDSIPGHLSVPGESEVRLLPPPSTEIGENGETRLSWDVSMHPGEGVIAFYNTHYLEPEELYSGGTVMVPFATISANSSLDSDQLELEYAIHNVATEPLRDIMLSVFLPSQVMTDPENDPVGLYEIARCDTTPVTESIEETQAVDGFLNRAKGTDFTFTLVSLDPGCSETLAIRCEITRTGVTGDVVPYLNLSYDCDGEVAEPFMVDVISAPSMTVDMLPTVYISNIGLPDVLTLSF